MELDCLTYGAEIEEIQEKNSRRWRHPLCLRDMMDTRQKAALPKKLWNLAGNYKVNLIHMRMILETELEKMDSDLKYVLGIMKHSKDKRQFAEYIRRNREFFSRNYSGSIIFERDADALPESCYKYEMREQIPISGFYCFHMKRNNSKNSSEKEIKTKEITYEL